MAYLSAANAQPQIVTPALLRALPLAASPPPANLYLVAGKLKAGTAAPANGRLVAFFPNAEGLSVNPVEAAGSSTTDGVTGSAPSVQVTATFAGAEGAVTYAWARVDSGGSNFLIDNAALAAPTFSIASGTSAYDATQYWRCTATTATQTKLVIVKVRLLRTVTGGSFTASITPAESLEGGARGDTLTDNLTCTPSGEVGPCSYLWEWFSGGAGITLSNATSATCTLTGSTTPGSFDIERTGILRCTVTDLGAGSAEAFDDANVDWIWTSGA